MSGAPTRHWMGGVAAALPLLILPMPPLAGQGRPMGHIQVKWDRGQKPGRVSFDGGPDFADGAGAFEGRYRINGRWTLHRLAVSYGTYQMPLTVLAGPGSDPTVLRAHKADYALCNQSDVLRIWSTELTGTVDERAALMTNARRLATLRTETCPPVALNRMIVAYFRANCSLAGDPHSPIVMSDDALALYGGIARTRQQKQEVLSCTGKAERRVLEPLLSDQAEAASGTDVDALDRITADLLAYASDPDWAHGFTALHIDADAIRARQLQGLYQMQLRAGADDAAAALAINRKIAVLLDKPDYARAFRLAHLDRDRLDQDAALYRSRLPSSD